MKHEFQRPAKKYQSKRLKKPFIRLYSSAAYNQNYEENEKYLLLQDANNNLYIMEENQNLRHGYFI